MTLFEVLHREINEKIESILSRLGNGQAHDYAEYRFYCGALYSLYAMNTYIAELKSNVEGEE